MLVESGAGSVFRGMPHGNTNRLIWRRPWAGAGAQPYASNASLPNWNSSCASTALGSRIEYTYAACPGFPLSTDDHRGGIIRFRSFSANCGSGQYSVGKFQPPATERTTGRYPKKISGNSDRTYSWRFRKTK